MEGRSIHEQNRKGVPWLRGFYYHLRLPAKKDPPRRWLCPKYPERSPEDVNAIYEHFEKQIRDELGIRERTGGARMILNVWNEFIDDGCADLTEATRYDHSTSRDHYITALGDHPIGAWTYICSKKFRQHLEKKKLKPRTILKHQKNLQAFLNWCLLEDVQVLQRQIKIKLIKVTKEPPAKYTREEKQMFQELAFKEYETNPNQLRLFLLARYSIMRRKEMWALPKRHIDLDAGTITVKDVTELDFKVKTHVQRTIKIHPVLLDFMRKDFKRFPRLYFLDTGSGPFAHADALTQIMVRMRDRLKIRPAAKILQGLRSTGVSDLLLSSKDHVKVAQLAGHSEATMLTSYKNIVQYDGGDIIDGLD